MISLSKPRRAARPKDWSSAKIVTFIVTLAASRSVTLAARTAGMSRKSAYALRGREPHFSQAWREALAVPPIRRQGDKVKEVENPLLSPVQGNNLRDRDRGRDDRLRAAHFTRLAADLLLPANALSLRRQPGG